MQKVIGTLLECAVVSPKPDKITGLYREPFLQLSLLSRFSKFGKEEPTVVSIKAPLNLQNDFEKKIGQKVELGVILPAPQFSVDLVESNLMKGEAK